MEWGGGQSFTIQAACTAETLLYRQDFILAPCPRVLQPVLEVVTTLPGWCRFLL